MPEPFGAFVLILHGHIPYVLGHGTTPHGANMLFEAAAETYIPILWALEELEAEDISANITISLSPITVEQLTDDRFKEWFADYLKGTEQAAAQNADTFENDGNDHLAYLAGRWQGRYRAIHEAFVEGYDRDIVGRFAEMHKAGHIEVMTCGATHAYFPLLHEDTSIEAQIRQAAQTHEKYFDSRPRGIWLPECAYRPRAEWAPPPEIGYSEPPYSRDGIEQLVADNGFDYFIVDTHMLGGGNPLPVEASKDDITGKAWSHIRHVREASPYEGPKTPYRPYFVGDRFEDHSPVAVLVRDPETSQQVWSGWHGYPGDYWYLEFHKKHKPGDLRYWRVTDDDNDLATKEPYEPQRADNKLHEHAGHFLSLVKQKLEDAEWAGGMPVVCAPYDAELFGHWWYEGTRWLSKMLRWMNEDPQVSVMKASEYVSAEPPDTAITLPEGSWGAGGGHYVWMNEEVAWTWHLIYEAEKDYKDLVNVFGRGNDSTMRKIIKQAARELMLMHASDWQFLITTWSAHDYASERVKYHYDDFKFLTGLARDYADTETLQPEDRRKLKEISTRDVPFDDVDPLWFVEK